MKIFAMDKKVSRCRTACIALAFLVFPHALVGQQSGPIEGSSRSNADSLEVAVDRFVHEAMARIGAVPGLAVSVVRADTTLLERAWGLRDHANQLQATTETGFYIASATKSYVGLLTTLLDRRGLIDLDAPLTACLPELDLNGTVQPNSNTMRDLLRHTRGWENDAVNIRTAYTDFVAPTELRRLLASHTTIEDDGYFAYDNIGYIVTDLCFRERLGLSWKELLDTYVLAPLGLRHTTAYMSEAAGGGNLALPHLWDGATYRIVPPKTDAVMHAAGGLVTTAHDAGRWLRVHLAQGRLDGERVFPADVIAEVLQRQVSADLSFWEFQRQGYGIGWFDGARRGERVLHHFGGYPGAHAHFSLMPDRDFGVAALVNGGGPGAYLLPHIIASYVYDVLLGRPDALEAARAAMEKAAEDARLSAAEREKLWRDLQRLKEEARPPGHPHTLYSGTYQNERFGTVLVAQAPNHRLWIDWGAREGDLVSLGDDSFLADWEPGLRPDTVRFMVREGEPAASFVWNDNVFTRVP